MTARKTSGCTLPRMKGPWGGTLVRESSLPDGPWPSIPRKAWQRHASTQRWANTFCCSWPTTNVTSLQRRGDHEGRAAWEARPQAAPGLGHGTRARTSWVPISVGQCPLFFTVNPGSFPSRGREGVLAGGFSQPSECRQGEQEGFSGKHSHRCWYRQPSVLAHSRAEKVQGQLEKVAFSFGTLNPGKVWLPLGSASFTHRR